MKVKIYFKHSSECFEDSVVIEAETPEQILKEFVTFRPEVNLDNCWSEVISE